MTASFSPCEVALLRAALLDGDAARKAFVEWRSQTDLTRQQETGQLRMLPLLYANMERLGISDPDMDRLHGVHRHAWAQSRRRQHFAATLVRHLAGRSIPALFTKGVALAQDYYPAPALRPMQDVDIFVPRNQAEEAIELLLQTGWEYHEPCPAYVAGGAERTAFMVLHNGLGLHDDDGNEADLHWEAVHECATPFLSDWFWDDTEPFEISGTPAMRLGPGPLLFHVVAHGLRPNVVSPLRWVVDATMILKRSGERIQWDRFWQAARCGRMEIRMAEGLATVERITGRPLPEGARRSGKASAVERLENAAFGRTRDGEFPRVAAWLLRAAKMLRLWNGTQRLILLRILRQWLTVRIGMLIPQGHSRGIGKGNAPIGSGGD